MWPRYTPAMALCPRVTHCEEDAGWGQPGSTKKVFVAPSLTQKGGFASVDKVIERIENKYWKIEVSDFQAWMLGFYKFTGEWQTTRASGAENTDRLYLYPACAHSLALSAPMAFCKTVLAKIHAPGAGQHTPPDTKQRTVFVSINRCQWRNGIYTGLPLYKRLIYLTPFRNLWHNLFSLMRNN
jgi:hypothetical protein